jgi:hypothetical protein
MKRLFLILFLLLMVGVVSADTLIIYSLNGDNGEFEHATGGASYAAHRGGAGNAVYTGGNFAPTLLRNGSAALSFYAMGRSFHGFNTSIVGGGNTITSAKLGVYVYDKDNKLGSPDYGITGFTPASYTGDYVAGDYDSFGNTEFATRVPYASVSSTYQNWTLNAAGIAAINKTGWSNFMIRDSWDLNNSFTGSGGANLEYSQVRWFGSEGFLNKDPFLEITYTTEAPPDTTPPASITGLGNITTCQNITWQWTNPLDADFNHTMVWKNNVFQYNLSNVTTSDLWESLVENTAYTFSSKTVDITGNINTTFVNLTSTTDTCPVPTTEPTTTATTAPPTTTTASPTPTPIPTPLAGCTYFNLTGVTFGFNSTDWNVTEGLNTWGVSTFNATQGNVSWWICRATPITTAPLTWQPLINPSTDIKIDWLKLLWLWWWLPVLILAMILLFRRQ